MPVPRMPVPSGTGTRWDRPFKACVPHEEHMERGNSDVPEFSTPAHCHRSETRHPLGPGSSLRVKREERRRRLRRALHSQSTRYRFRQARCGQWKEGQRLHTDASILLPRAAVFKERGRPNFGVLQAPPAKGSGASEHSALRRQFLTPAVPDGMDANPCVAPRLRLIPAGLQQTAPSRDLTAAARRPPQARWGALQTFAPEHPEAVGKRQAGR